MSSSGAFLGAGIGECSSSEEKYAWRRAICDEEFDETPENRRRVKFSKYQGKIEKTKQIRTNPADVSNTVLKMAKKRGLVDAVLTVTAASDLFTQDIEDLPEELRETQTHPSVPRQEAKPERAPYPAADFATNLPKWRELIESGRKTADAIVQTIQTKAVLTDEQIARIRACVVKAEPVEAELVEEGAAQ